MASVRKPSISKLLAGEGREIDGGINRVWLPAWKMNMARSPSSLWERVNRDP
jgi:hypothetical protein